MGKFGGQWMDGLLASLTLAGVSLGLSACEAPYQVSLVTESGTSVGTKPSVEEGVTPVPPSGTQRHEEFSLAANAGKVKIDLLFVVDNSGSMSDNQDALAAGFSKFGETYFKNPALDICTMIITSDRYNGRGTATYSRERKLACSSPAGTETETAAQRAARIAALLADFETQVRVGTSGSGRELLAKSLVAFLRGEETYSGAATGITSANSASLNPFFRSDAIANITFITDENNIRTGTASSVTEGQSEEAINDLPDTTSATDPRRGVREFLDGYFNARFGSSGYKPTYSITSLLDTVNTAAEAANLMKLVPLVGRDSVLGDVNSKPDDFTGLYRTLGRQILIRARSVELAYSILTHEDVSIRYVNATGAFRTLAQPMDYTISGSRMITLSESLYSQIQEGDRLVVDYLY